MEKDNMREKERPRDECCKLFPFGTEARAGGFEGGVGVLASSPSGSRQGKKLGRVKRHLEKYTQVNTQDTNSHGKQCGRQIRL